MVSARRIKIVLNKSRTLIGSFSFPNCGIILLKGENGCGKSTLLRATLGFKPFKGKLYYNGSRHFIHLKALLYCAKKRLM